VVLVVHKLANLGLDSLLEVVGSLLRVDNLLEVDSLLEEDSPEEEDILKEEVDIPVNLEVVGILVVDNLELDILLGLDLLNDELQHAFPRLQLLQCVLH
jgi:hypothetical protein